MSASLSDSELASLILARPGALRIVRRALGLGRSPKPIRRLFMLGIYEELSRERGKPKAREIVRRAFSIFSDKGVDNALSLARRDIRASLPAEIARRLKDNYAGAFITMMGVPNWQSDEGQRELREILKVLKQIPEIKNGSA